MPMTQDKPGRTAAFAFLAALGPLSIEASLPWLPRVGDGLGVDPSGLQLTLSVWLLGFALALALHGPLSTKHGRRTLLVAGLALYAVATFLCALAPVPELLTLGRFLQGSGGGAAIGMAMLWGLGVDKRSPMGMSRLAAGLGLLSAAAPAASGFLVEALGWRAGFGAMLLHAAAAFVLVALVLPEEGPRPEPPRQGEPIWREFMRNDRYVAFLVSACLSFAGVFAFVSASAFVFQDAYELRPGLAGIAYGAAALGFVLGAGLGGLLTRMFSIDPALRLGAATQALGGLGVMGGILFGPGHPAEIVAPMALFLLGAGIILPQTACGACELFPKHSSEAWSVLMICQLTFGALSGLMVGAMLGTSALPLGMGVASLGVLSAIVHSATRDARREGREVADMQGF